MLQFWHLAHIILVTEGLFSTYTALFVCNTGYILKLDIHNLHHKKVPFAYTILFPDIPTFPHIMKLFLISGNDYRNIEYYLKCNEESH